MRNKAIAGAHEIGEMPNFADTPLLDHRAICGPIAPSGAAQAAHELFLLVPYDEPRPPAPL